MKCDTTRPVVTRSRYVSTYDTHDVFLVTAGGRPSGFSIRKHTLAHTRHTHARVLAWVFVCSRVCVCVGKLVFRKRYTASTCTHKQQHARESRAYVSRTTASYVVTRRVVVSAAAACVRVSTKRSDCGYAGRFFVATTLH